ncbi:MAG: Holliday junction branch migration protein RuvA [Oscillospiraceae bacterium]|nr:Holliday junction branch migration protein RuvA [Oscillospiraceae bacterium]
MFNYINGIVAELTSSLAVLDCGGVGFEIAISAYTAGRLKTGEKAKLYIFSNIREDTFDLYGFYTKNEKSTFEMLIGVSGVGTKAAMSILSSATPENLAMAIISGNDKALTAAPGVGKKLAQRIILELKDKLAKATEEISFADINPVTPLTSDGTAVRDATAALSVLGYAPAEISAALKSVSTEGMEVADIVRACLKQMVKG